MSGTFSQTGKLDFLSLFHARTTLALDKCKLNKSASAEENWLAVTDLVSHSPLKCDRCAPFLCECLGKIDIDTIQYRREYEQQ